MATYIEVDSLEQDPRLAVYRNLKDRQLAGRDEREGVFIAEGELVVRRLIASGFSVRSVLVSPPRRDAMRAALDRLSGEVPVFVARQEVFDAIAGLHMHRGVLAAGARGGAMRVDELLASSPPGLVLLEDLTNLDNLGGVFRNVAALGRAGMGIVLSPGCADPLYRKAVRVAIGNVFHVPFARSTDWEADVGRIRGSGYELVALTPGEGSLDIWAARDRLAGRRLALMLGSEGPGLSAWSLEHAGLRVRIPVNREADSVNVATAGALALLVLG